MFVRSTTNVAEVTEAQKPMRGQPSLTDVLLGPGLLNEALCVKGGHKGRV